jgi:predicted nucleic acid-binding protein
VKVVSNAGPLIALGRLGRLGLLSQLYGVVLISPEVHQEVVVNGLRLGAPDADAVRFLIQKAQIQVVPIELASNDPLHTLGIDKGEAETLALARQERADWVLIDDAHARRAARSVDIRCKGTIGILLEAFRKNMLPMTEFELLIFEIKRQPTLWIGEQLCDDALAQARSESADRP